MRLRPPAGKRAWGQSPSAEEETTTHQQAGGDQFLPIERKEKPCWRAAEERAEPRRWPGEEGGSPPAR